MVSPCRERVSSKNAVIRKHLITIFLFVDANFSKIPVLLQTTEIQ